LVVVVFVLVGVYLLAKGVYQLTTR
jgi:hypothetical protein